MIKINKYDKSEPFNGYPPLGGNMVILARLSRGLTTTQLAKQAGTTQSNIAELEAGYDVPSINLVQRIASVTNYPESFFRQNEYIYPPISLHSRIEYK